MNEKVLHWMGSSLKDLKALPDEIRRAFGHALHLAQAGEKHEAAKPLRGFGSAGVLEVVESDEGGTYRAVYAVRFHNAVYVLHCFQKKSTRGIKTADHDIELIKSRLKAAEAHAKENGYA